MSSMKFFDQVKVTTDTTPRLRNELRIAIFYTSNIVQANHDSVQNQ